MNKILVGQYYGYYDPTHTLANKDGLVYEHRLIASQMLGRDITASEVVHHIDENKLNNDPTNLMIFKSKAHHTAFHKGAEAKSVNGVYEVNLIDKSICPICGQKKSYNANLCSKCSLKIRNKRVNTIDTDELQTLVESWPMTKVADYYGVSDNTVRKWCKKKNIKF